jgi:hypothetical protein
VKHRAGDRVGSERRAADRRGAEPLGLGRDQLPSGAEAAHGQEGPARVDVVLRRAPAGEGHLAEHQAVGAQCVE